MDADRVPLSRQVEQWQILSSLRFLSVVEFAIAKKNINIPWHMITIPQCQTTVTRSFQGEPSRQQNLNNCQDELLQVVLTGDMQ